ncbi:MAG: DUF2933 domain-containing protein [Parvibaculum sp.]|nr:DUF2933 domain-containing protein [Parvibaculum sp.]
MTTRRDDRNVFWRSPAGLTLCVFLAVAALFLVLEHGAHLLGAWPLLCLLLCVGMHVVMHRGHGGHGSDGGSGDER